MSTELSRHRTIIPKNHHHHVENVPTKPLQKCDIQGNTVAGSTINAVLSFGLSKDWTERLKSMTCLAKHFMNILHHCIVRIA